MIQFPDELISEYVSHKNLNGENFNWWSFVNMKSDIQTALGFVKLFYPDVLDVEGCFILKNRFFESIFKQWREKETEKSIVEKMVNLYEIKDFFHINVDDNDNQEKLQRAFGEALKQFWTMSFNERYPEKNVKVILFEEYDELFITVYTNDAEI